MSQQTIMKISDTKQLSKILNDLKEYFPTISREDLNEEDRMRQTVEYVLDVELDEVCDREHYSELANSTLFAFTNEQKSQFIEDLKNENATLKRICEKYLNIGVKQLSLLLDAVIDIHVSLISKGSSYYGSVLDYHLFLKSGITIRDVFVICGKFMDHPAHSIDSVECLNDHQIKIVVDEST